MTNKEFFLKVLGDERGRFRKVIESLPDDKMEHKVHDRSREAGNLASQLATQWLLVSDAVKTGNVSFEGSSKTMPVAEMLIQFDKNFDAMLADLKKIADDDWENGDAAAGDMWKTKKYDMAWSFLFDAIHHRGQLTTFLRAMGAKVPSIYGPSADSET